ncbi:stabilizer of axonemal microtubules 4 [Pezoporus flaviventris]|uniref:stabilizer of axonemal microtubules 4 n=1 Tax=Pezoporus flaviventris TaxID=889875 RepID=UPI002AB2479C|nr:stabilizer of axonemal microtubules 4 [Pezoporus flaviventris]
MEDACPFACHCIELQSTGMDTLSPSEKALTGGSSDLMDFYATNYPVAHGQPGFCPQLGHHTGTGYVTDNHSAMSCLLRPHSEAEGHCQDAMATTAEHFKPLWLPNGRSILPCHIHEPQSGYLQECPPSRLRAGMVSPQHMRLQQRRPRLRENRCTDPLQPDTLQKVTLGTKEPSGFTKGTKRTDSFLPPLPIQQGQPLGVSLTTRDCLPSVRSHGNETLPTLPPGSKRGSGFTREGRSCLGRVVLPTLGHSASLVSRGLEATRETQARLLGRQAAGRMMGAWSHPYPHPHPHPHPMGTRSQLASIPQEPSGYTTNYGQYVTSCLTPSPAAPAWDATWIARPIGGIQPQHPSGFSTNNHPTGLGDVIDHLLV